MEKIIKLLEVADELVREELKKYLDAQTVNQYLVTAQCDIARAIQSLVDFEQDKRKME